MIPCSSGDFELFFFPSFCEFSFTCAEQDQKVAYLVIVQEAEDEKSLSGSPSCRKVEVDLWALNRIEFRVSQKRTLSGQPRAPWPQSQGHPGHHRTGRSEPPALCDDKTEYRGPRRPVNWSPSRPSFLFVSALKLSRPA